MYFVLRCSLPKNEKGEALLEIHNCFEIGNVWHWRDGKKLEPDEQDVPTPIMIDFEPFRGYQGPPVELLDACIPIMSKRLADALTEAGVDNIDFFSANLKNSVTGQLYDYMAFKVVGLVLAANLDKSKWESYDGITIADTSFESLAFDESKSKGLLMFRLAENINALMIHESVRNHILAKGINSLTFVRPEDWMHL